MPGSTREPTSLFAATKFRVPRLRRSSIFRERLVARLASAASESAAFAVFAQASDGKTTLLSQFANSVEAPTRVARG